MYYPRRIHRIRIYPYGRLKYLVFVEIQVSVQMSPDVFTLGFFLSTHLQEAVSHAHGANVGWHNRAKQFSDDAGQTSGIIIPFMIILTK